MNAKPDKTKIQIDVLVRQEREPKLLGEILLEEVLPELLKIYGNDSVLGEYCKDKIDESNNYK